MEATTVGSNGWTSWMVLMVSAAALLVVVVTRSISISTCSVWIWIWRRSGPLEFVLRIPLLGGVIFIALNFHTLYDVITDCCRSSSNTFRAPFLGFNYIYTVHPDNFRHVLLSNFHNYVKVYYLACYGSFVYDKQQEFLGNGIFSVDGDEWKQQRKTASYEFTSRTLKALCEMAFQGNALRLAAYLLAESRAGQWVDMQDLFLRLAFDSFSKIGFGLDMRTLQKNPPPQHLALSNAFDDCNAMVCRRYIDPSWRLKRWLMMGTEARLSKQVSTLNNILHSLMEERRKELDAAGAGVKYGAKSDLLSRFVELKKEYPEEITDQKIRDIVVNFMFAGRDTTALTLSWFFYAISDKPAIQERLVEEILSFEDSDMGAAQDCDGFPSEEQIEAFSKTLNYEKLSKLQYLHACLQETLRLYPVVPQELRMAVAADTFPDGTKVNKGDGVILSLYGMGRMEWLWGKDACEFHPQRFIRDGVCQPESPFKLPAFLAGPRTCLGKDFAFLQMKVTAATLIRFFKFDVVPQHKVQHRVMMTLHMSKDGLRMNVRPRFKKVLEETIK